ncbi:MAG TPA: NADPH-dependent FMN reductase [Alphaproteobacteria bacterium]|nr:NADPH-dependent FMN reductase [Alphaproteobacteria bacterium]
MAEGGAVKILGICGSLRKGSYNRMALNAAVELVPPDVSIEIFEGLRDIPLYDEDVRQQGFPEPVQKLRTAIAAADALLFVTPEYNYSVPGVLKNAIDWASRPPDQPFNGKPMAVMGASPGNFGTVRAQYHLRQSMVFLNGCFVNQPEVMIGQAAQRFDADGKLTDEATRKFVANLLTALAAWTRRMRA